MDFIVPYITVLARCSDIQVIKIIGYFMLFLGFVMCDFNPEYGVEAARVGMNGRRWEIEGVVILDYLAR